MSKYLHPEAVAAYKAKRGENLGNIVNELKQTQSALRMSVEVMDSNLKDQTAVNKALFSAIEDLNKELAAVKKIAYISTAILLAVALVGVIFYVR